MHKSIVGLTITLLVAAAVMFAPAAQAKIVIDSQGRVVIETRDDSRVLGKEDKQEDEMDSKMDDDKMESEDHSGSSSGSDNSGSSSNSGSDDQSDDNQSSDDSKDDSKHDDDNDQDDNSGSSSAGSSATSSSAGDQDDDKDDDGKDDRRSDHKVEDFVKQFDEAKDLDNYVFVDQFDELLDQAASLSAQAEIEYDEEKQEGEIRLPDGRRIKFKQEGDKTEASLQDSRGKVKVKRENGQLKVSLETPDGKSYELEGDQLLKIQPSLLVQEWSVVDTPRPGVELILDHGGVGASTDLPVEIDLDGNKLQVQDANGKPVSIDMPPDEVLQLLLQQDVVDQVLSQASDSAELELVIDPETGMPVYQVEGVSEQKFIGLIPVKIRKKVKVSIQTGEVLKVEQSLLDRLTDLIAF